MATETIPKGEYYIDRGSGKMELHFDKASYMALPQDLRSDIKRYFLFSRGKGAWISKGQGDSYMPQNIAEKLGFKKAGEVGEKVSFAEQMERKAERAAERAERYEGYSASARQRQGQLQKQFNELRGDIAFLTQPGRFAWRDKIVARYERGFAEAEKAKHFAEEAERLSKTSTQSQLKNPRYLDNRITQGEAELRKIERTAEEYRQKGREVPQYLEERAHGELDKLMFYKKAMVDIGGVKYSQANVSKGDKVLTRFGWGAVRSTGPKNMKVETGHGFALTLPYAEIKGHQGQEMAEAPKIAIGKGFLSETKPTPKAYSPSQTVKVLGRYWGTLDETERERLLKSATRPAELKSKQWGQLPADVQDSLLFAAPDVRTMGKALKQAMTKPKPSPKPTKEPWEMTYYEELPLTEKQAIAQRADKATSKYIKTLPEYQSAITEYKRWKEGEGKYIFGTAGKMEEPTKIYQEHYQRFLKQEVLKDYPELGKREVPKAKVEGITYYRGVSRHAGMEAPTGERRRPSVYLTRSEREAQFYGKDIEKVTVKPKNPMYSETAVDAAEKLGVLADYDKFIGSDPIKADEVIYNAAKKAGYDAIIRRDGDWVQVIDKGIIAKAESPKPAKEPWEMNKKEFYDWYADSNRQRGDRAPHVPEAIEYAATINDSDVDALYKQKSEGKVRTVEHKGTKMYLGSVLSARAATENLRESMIERSLSSGKPVPESVLRDYPELAVAKPTEATIDDAIAKAGSKYVKDMGKFLEDVKGKSVEEVVAMYPELGKKEEKPKGELIAKHTERKMSPSTGKDTDYVHEWRLVEKPDDAGPEWMGNKWGIERTFTKGGEVQSRDIMETADSKEKVVKLLPRETTYDKAEKYGLAKVHDEQRAKEKTAEEEAEKAEQEQERQAGERYEQRMKELGTRKGVKEGTISIYAMGKDYKSHTRKDVPGFIIGNGIGIAISGEGRYKDYTVTHLNTGKAMGHGWNKPKEAIALAKAIAEVGDWSKYKEEKDVPKTMMNEAAALVRGFTGKKLEPTKPKAEKPETPAKPEPKPKKEREKRETLMDKTMNEVVLYGGFPVRYGTMVRHLDEVAKSTGEKNWMAIRDAGLMGHHQRERMHPTKLPDDVQPLTYEEFKEVTNLPGGADMPEHIFKKMITIYTKEQRERFKAKEKPKAEKKEVKDTGHPTLDKYRALTEKYPEKIGDYIQRAKAEKASIVLGREFGESTESYFSRNPSAKRRWEDCSKAIEEMESQQAKPKKEPKPRKEIGILQTKPTKQSDRALAIDRSLLAKQVVSVDDPRWLKRPNRFDVRGIDTPQRGRIPQGVFTDKGKKRMSKRYHRGWKKMPRIITA